MKALLVLVGAMLISGLLGAAESFDPSPRARVGDALEFERLAKRLDPLIERIDAELMLQTTSKTQTQLSAALLSSMKNKLLDMRNGALIMRSGNHIAALTNGESLAKADLREMCGASGLSVHLPSLTRFVADDWRRNATLPELSPMQALVKQTADSAVLVADALAARCSAY